MEKRRSDVGTSGGNPEKPKKDFIKDAWRKARYPGEAWRAALSDGNNAFYRPESSQGSFDKNYNIKSTIDFIATLERDEKRILNLVLKDLIQEKHIKELKNNGDDVKIAKPIAHRMWQDILERSCASRRNAIDSKLGRLIPKPLAEVPSPETVPDQSGGAGPSGIHGDIMAERHDNQKQEYTVEKFNMPIFSHLTLNDLEELVREEQKSNNGNSGDQDGSQSVTKSDIEKAANNLKGHVEKLWEYRRKEHGILAYELLNGSNAESQKDLNKVKEEYKKLEDNVPYNKLLRDLAHRQPGQTPDGNVLLESPGWAGFARQFGHTYKPEAWFAKFLSKLPESTVRSPRRTALTLALLSPFAGAAASAVAGVGIGAVGAAAGVGIPLAGVYYGGKGIISLSARANKELKEWNKARKGKLREIKKARIEERDKVQEIKKSLEKNYDDIQTHKDKLKNVKELSDDKKNQNKQEIIDLKIERKKLLNDKKIIDNNIRRLRVMSQLKGLVGIHDSKPLRPPSVEEGGDAARSLSRSSQDGGQEKNPAEGEASGGVGEPGSVLESSVSVPARVPKDAWSGVTTQPDGDGVQASVAEGSLLRPSQDEGNHQGHEENPAGGGASGGAGEPVLVRVPETSLLHSPSRQDEVDSGTSTVQSDSHKNFVTEIKVIDEGWQAPNNNQAENKPESILDNRSRKITSDKTKGASQELVGSTGYRVADRNKNLKNLVISLWNTLAKRKSGTKELTREPKDALLTGKGGMTGVVPWIVERVNSKLGKQRLEQISPRSDSVPEAQNRVEKIELGTSKDIREKVGAHTFDFHKPNEDAHFFDE